MCVVEYFICKIEGVEGLATLNIATRSCTQWNVYTLFEINVLWYCDVYTPVFVSVYANNIPKHKWKKAERIERIECV